MNDAEERDSFPALIQEFSAPLSDLWKATLFLAGGIALLSATIYMYVMARAFWALGAGGGAGLLLIAFFQFYYWCDDRRAARAAQRLEDESPEERH